MKMLSVTTLYTEILCIYTEVTKILKNPKHELLKISSNHETLKPSSLTSVYISEAAQTASEKQS